MTRFLILSTKEEDLKLDEGKKDSKLANNFVDYEHTNIVYLKGKSINEKMKTFNGTDAQRTNTKNRNIHSLFYILCCFLSQANRPRHRDKHFHANIPLHSHSFFYFCFILCICLSSFLSLTVGLQAIVIICPSIFCRSEK